MVTYFHLTKEKPALAVKKDLLQKSKDVSTMKDILKSEKRFRYMMLDRMRQDCEYYLRIGCSANVLWAGDEVQHIQNMKDIWNSFDENDKPEWLTMEEILEFAKKMDVK